MFTFILQFPIFLLLYVWSTFTWYINNWDFGFLLFGAYFSPLMNLFYVTGCNVYTYGSDCIHCGNCSDGVHCNHVTGTCPNGCDAGMYGDKCDLGKMRIKFSFNIFNIKFVIFKPLSTENLKCNLYNALTLKYQLDNMVIDETSSRLVFQYMHWHNNTLFDAHSSRLVIDYHEMKK